jgi:hypothetical protein
MKQLSVMLLLCFFAANAHAQSGWTRKKNSYFVKASVNLFWSDQYYTPSGEKLKTSQFRQQAVSVYGEYGISDRLNVIVNFPVVKVNSFETSEPVAGIGDLKIELKYAILKKFLPLTIGIAPEFPTGSANNYSQNKTIRFERINLPTGDGEFNVWTTLAASASFHPVPAYISGSVGYNYRTHYKDFDFGDQIKFNVEVGYKLFDKVWLSGTLSAQHAVGTASGIPDFIRGDGTEFTAFGLGAAYEFIKNWSLSAQAWGYSDLIFDRKNLYSSPTYSIGVFYEIK